MGHAHDNIVALSLGTGNTALPWPRPGEASSLYTQVVPTADFKTDVRKMATAILDDPPDAATFVAHVMTGCGKGLDQQVSTTRIIRMNPLVSPMRSQAAGAKDPWCPPGDLTAVQFKYLLNLDMDAVDQAQVFAINHFGDLWLKDQVRNQPIRMNSDSLECELGQETFSSARDAWTRISAAQFAEPEAEPAAVGTP